MSVTRPVIENATDFTEAQINGILGTAARLLIAGQDVSAASILANATGRITHSDHDNWNGGQDTWLLTLTIPAEAFFELPEREEIEARITAALNVAVASVSERDHFRVNIACALDDDPDWRAKVAVHLTGQGITNQGRARSANVAARQHDGLLFRSQPEIHVYNALKRTGVPFAPLAVVLRGGLQYQRIEPDFVVFKDGQVMIVEIDGDLYHTERVAAAHVRLKFLLDEGARLERISADECDTPEKAKEAVDRVLMTIEKHRRAR